MGKDGLEVSIGTSMTALFAPVAISIDGPTGSRLPRFWDGAIPLSFDEDESLEAIILRINSDDHEPFADLIDASLDEWDAEDGWSFVKA